MLYKIMFCFIYILNYKVSIFLNGDFRFFFIMLIVLDEIDIVVLLFLYMFFLR